MHGFKPSLFVFVLVLLAACTGEPVKTIRIGAPAATGLSGREDIPLLQIDTGGHHNRMRGLLFTPDGKQLISAGFDQVIRIWDIESGRTTGILRGELRTGLEGTVQTIALSPDGRRLAAAGILPAGGADPAAKASVGSIRLYDLSTRRLERLLPDPLSGGISTSVLSLAFSPDGALLASSDNFGFSHIWDMAQRKYLRAVRPGPGMSWMDTAGVVLSAVVAPETAIKNLFRDLGTMRILSSTFLPDGKRLVTAHQDAQLRLWDVTQYKLLATLAGHTGQVNAVAVSPKGDLIASGGMDHTIRLWDGRTGQPLKVLADQGAIVAWLSFAPDGRKLLSTDLDFTGKRSLAHVWSIPEGRELATYRGHEEAGIGVIGVVSPDGRIAATAGGADSTIDLWSLESGQRIKRLAGSGSAVVGVGFATDGGALVWSTQRQFDKASRSSREYQRMGLPRQALDPVGEPKRRIGDMNRGNQRERWALGSRSLRTRTGGPLNIEGAILEVAEGNTVKWAVERGPAEGFLHSAYTFAPDGRQVVSGGANGTLTAYDADGNLAGHYVGHTGLVRSVALSPDGKLLASGADDQTVRLWNTETFELLLTIFYDNDDRWVAWTPSGHYIASADGEADSFFGWQVNRGADRDADFVTARQLRKQLYRPDIVNAAVRLRSAGQALGQAGDSGFRITELNRALPPVFRIGSPADNSKVDADSVDVALEFDANPEPLLEIDIHVNGSKVLGGASGTGQRRNLRVPLQGGENRITLTASNRIGDSVERILVVQRAGAPATAEKGKLYVVAVGVNQFESPGLADHNLIFAVADAGAVDAALNSQAGKAYTQVESIVLTDQALSPNKANIEQALSTLSEVGPQDTVVFFLAGHGVNQGAEYYFLPRDTRMTGDLMDPSTVISWKFIQEAMVKTAGRRILFIDTCHSGNAFNQRLAKDSRDGYIFLMSATDAESVSYEQPEWGHGAFTLALLQGLKGGADLHSDRSIDITELNSYVYGKVKDLTRSMQPIQQPISATLGLFKDFVFAKL